MKTITRTEYGKYFTTKVRTNGSHYTTLKDEAPEELTVLVREIHDIFSALPNDWIYEVISDAFEELEDNDLENCSIEGDHCYSDLYKWLNYGFADDLCQEYLDDCCTIRLDFWDILGSAQVYGKERIYQAVNDFIQG
jgi:hypothetical protein